MIWTTEHDATEGLLDTLLVRNLRTTKEGRYLLASNVRQRRPLVLDGLGQHLQSDRGCR